MHLSKKRIDLTTALSAQAQAEMTSAKGFSVGASKKTSPKGTASAPPSATKKAQSAKMAASVGKVCKQTHPIEATASSPVSQNKTALPPWVANKSTTKAKSYVGESTPPREKAQTVVSATTRWIVWAASVFVVSLRVESPYAANFVPT